MRFLLLPSVLFFMLCTSLSGQIWTGNVDADWNNPANWSGGVLPNNNSDIEIDPVNYTGVGAHPQILSNSLFSPVRTDITGGAQLLISANLTTSDRITISDPGTVVSMNAGVLSVAVANQRKLIVSDDAVFDFSGGQIIVGRDLSISLGAQFFVSNQAVLNVNLGLLTGENSAIAPSRFVQNGGTVNIAQDLEFSALIPGDTPTVEVNAGTLTVNGMAVWEGGPADAPHLIVAGGTVTIWGDATSLGANVDIDVSGSGILIFKANLWMLGTSDRFDQSGSSVVRFQQTGMWQNNGLFTGTGGRVIFDGTTTLSGSFNNYQFFNLVINNGRQLNHLAPFSIQVNANWTNNGTFTANTNTVIFGGTGNRTIGGASTTTFFGLTVNKSGGSLNLATETQVSGLLNMSNRNLLTSETAMLHILDNAIATPGSNASYVDGPMKKSGDDAFVFPVGNGGKWRRIGISAPANPGSEFTAAYFAAISPAAGCFQPNLSAVDQTEYWNLNQTAGAGAPVYITLYWENAAESGISSCASLVPAVSKGDCFTEIPGSASGNCTGTGAGTVQTNVSVVAAGSYTFGFTGTLAACEAPADINVIHQATNKVVVTWAPQAGALSFNLRYRVLGSTTWTNVSSTVNYRVVSNLTPSTTYEFEVRTQCPSGPTTWTSGTFTTYSGSEPCGTPTPGVAIALSPNTEQLYWDFKPGATSYTVRYRHAGTTGWVMASSAQPTKQLVSLTPGTDYEYQIRAKCGTVWSAYSFSAFFTTSATLALAAPLTDGNIQNEGGGLEIFVSPNPASHTLNVDWRDQVPVAITIFHMVDQKVHLQLSNPELAFHPIDISRLAPGAYILQAKLRDGRTEAVRFLKSNTGY